MTQRANRPCECGECPTTPIRRRGRAAAVVALCLLFCLLVACSLAGCGAAPEGGSPSAPAEGDGLAARALDDYSWEELAEVSARIAAAGSDEEGTAIAREFGILDESGAIADQVRRFLLTDGTVCEVRVVGVRHDEKADGSGKAGLTFLCAEVPAEARYNATDTVDGGWEASGLRAWLASDFKALLPKDLAGLLVPVRKLSNNVGFTQDVSAVTGTSDELWVPSAREVLGDVDWFTTEYQDGAAVFDDVLNAEGAQYQWFAQALAADGTAALTRTYKGASTGWWLRSVVPSSQWFGDAPYASYVMDTGYPEGQASPTETEGALVGFCL